MRVNPSTSNPVQSGDVASTSKTERADKSQKAKKGEVSPGASESVRAEISSKAKDLAKSKAVAESAPDVREDKVAELKKRIEGGKYKVDADAIANKLVDEHLKMEGLA